MTDASPAPTYSHTGECKCLECGAVNRFRSDFTYHVGEWVLGLRCVACQYGAGQQVVRLT